jgi:hypothetical protein
MKTFWLAVSWLLATAVGGEALAADGAGTTFVRGFAGDPVGGFRQSWHTHLGMVPLSGIRQQKDCREIQWHSAPIPANLAGDTVTFVWSGAMGMGPSSRGNFSVAVAGHAVAEFDVVTESTEFPCQAEGCRLLYQVLFTYNGLDSSGYFYLTVPRQWLKPGQPAVLRVTGKEAGLANWFALVRADDAPLAVPGRAWKPFVKVDRTAPGTPPRPGTEASYEWYLKQYEDPGVFTPIGPPGDPAETAVSPHGELMYANDRLIAGTGYVANALLFGLYDGGRVVPIGSDAPSHQKLADGHLPIVTTRWRYRDLDVRQTAFARPLRGTESNSGLESTLAWAVLEITNRAAAPREITFLAAQCGDEKRPKRELTFRDGVVLEGGSARFSALPAVGFSIEFKPVFPETQRFQSAKPLDVLRHGGLLNALAMRGRLAGGQSVRLVVNRVFDFPGDYHANANPPKVAPEELTTRSVEGDLAAARSAWNGLSAPVRRFVTPDSALNRIVEKAMLDGYFLTKRWSGRYIVFDSVCYRCQWDDASTKWFYALDLMGDHATAGKLLDTVFARQGQRKPVGTRTREGSFSDVTNTTGDGSAASWTSCNGWALWAMAEHTRLTGDREWLTAHKKAILDGCAWIVRERQFSKEKPNNPCAGLIYGKFVCDMPDEGGVSGVGYFTYTDAISYMGLHQMAQLLADWGHGEGGTLLAEAERYRRDILSAVDRLTDKSRDPWYVPWILHAPKHEDAYFNGVCGPINLAYGGVVSRDDPRMQHVIRWNIDRTYKGSPETSASANMFYSQDLACVLLEQGRVEDFLRMFYTILASNISHETLTTCEWRSNTQPHVHSISSLVRMFRTMLVQERDGSLFLLQGVPRRWLEPGRAIRITEAPTWYGPLSLEVSSGGPDGGARLRLQVPPRLGEVPIRLRLRLPEGRRIGEVTVDGRPHRDVDGEWVTLRGIQGDAEIRLTVVAKLGPSQ